MSSSSASRRLAPAGWLILLTAEAARLANEYRRRFGPYFGVDRLPPFVYPIVGEEQTTDRPGHALIEEWLGARSEKTAFINNLRIATSLATRFFELGYSIELAYCEVALDSYEDSRESWYQVADSVPPPPLTYGYDVSWPSCTHSAILQPGLVPNSTSWRTRLNMYGLLDNYDDALLLREQYLRVYPYPPFDIYSVHSTLLPR